MLQEKEHTYSIGRLEFTYIERAIFCDKCGEPCYVSAINMAEQWGRLHFTGGRMK